MGPWRRRGSLGIISKVPTEVRVLGLRSVDGGVSGSDPPEGLDRVTRCPRCFSIWFSMG